MLVRYNFVIKEVKESFVNLCLVLFCFIDGCVIIMIEGLCGGGNNFYVI